MLIIIEIFFGQIAAILLQVYTIFMIVELNSQFAHNGKGTYVINNVIKSTCSYE